MNAGAVAELLTALTTRLEEFGLSVDVKKGVSDSDPGFDVDVVLTRGQARQEYAVVFKRLATLSEIGTSAANQDNDQPKLIGSATAVSPRSADAVRRAGVQYVDVVGNAWIHFGDVLIDVRGRRPEGKSTPSAGRAGGNLFSTARAQVAFALLQWPDLWNQPQRTVADAAGVSLGQAHSALTMLREAGFGPGGHRGDSELLDLWVAAFPTGLAPKLVLARYQGSIPEAGAIVEDRSFVAGEVFSGEVAAGDLLRPTTLTVYVDHLDPMMAVKNRWRSDGAPNIIVRRKFWMTPASEMPDQDRSQGELPTAPAVLVYADLMASEDPRAREAAVEWRKRLCST